MRELELLHHLAIHRRPATLREVADAAEMSRSTAHRLLEKLSADGWVLADGRPRRYRLSLKTAELGLSQLRRNRVREDSMLFLVEGAQRLRGPCYLALYEDGDAVFLDAVDIIAEKTKFFMLAVRTPATASAAGKVLLCHQPEEEIERVLSLGTPSLTQYTKVERQQILDDLAATREQGVAVADREVRDAWGVASPIHDADGNVVAAIGTGFEGAKPEPIDDVIALIMEMATKASVELGYRPPRSSWFLRDAVSRRAP